MYPILLKLGPFSIHAYGFMIALAFLLGILVSLRYAKKEGIKTEAVLDLAIYIIVAAIVGSRLLYVIGEWGWFKERPLEIFMVHKGGLVFLGGFILALLVILGYSRIKGIPLLKLFDVLAPGAALGYAVGRIGCFLNGCCFGLPTRLPWGVIFPPGSLAYLTFPGKPIHPTQLYSSASMFVVFLLMIILYRRKKFDGYLFFWWIVLYSIYRFLMEFIRYNPFYWLGLSPNQWLVLPLAAWAIYSLISKQRHLTK